MHSPLLHMFPMLLSVDGVLWSFAIYVLLKSKTIEMSRPVENILTNNTKSKCRSFLIEKVLFFGHYYGWTTYDSARKTKLSNSDIMSMFSVEI